MDNVGKKGKWELVVIKNHTTRYKCSECVLLMPKRIGDTSWLKLGNFCPLCGATMETRYNKYG